PEIAHEGIRVRLIHSRRQTQLRQPLLLGTRSNRAIFPSGAEALVHLRQSRIHLARWQTQPLLPSCKHVGKTPRWIIALWHDLQDAADVEDDSSNGHGFSLTFSFSLIQL